MKTFVVTHVASGRVVKRIAADYMKEYLSGWSSDHAYRFYQAMPWWKRDRMVGTCRRDMGLVIGIEPIPDEVLALERMVGL